MAYIQFALSFLITGDNTILVQVLELKGTSQLLSFLTKLLLKMMIKNVIQLSCINKQTGHLKKIILITKVDFPNIVTLLAVLAKNNVDHIGYADFKEIKELIGSTGWLRVNKHIVSSKSQKSEDVGDCMVLKLVLNRAILDVLPIF